MKLPKRENKYLEGGIVYAKKDPSIKLIVRHYANNLYHCKVAQDPTLKELQYYEKELTDEIEITAPTNIGK